MKRTQGQTIKLVQTSLLVISYFLSALHVALDWWYPARMFQTDGASPLLVLDFLAEQPVFFLVIEALTLAFNTTITDAISIWRCWVLYDRKLKVVLFPLLCIMTSIVMAIVALIDRIEFTFGLMHATANPAEGIARWQHLLIAYFVPSLASTVYTTGMIIYHILKAHLQVSKITRPSFSSTRVAIMIVESALLYTISHVLTVGLLVHVSPNFNFSQDILAQMAGISPTLLILRVCIGKYSETVRMADSEKMTAIEFHSRTTQGMDTVVEEEDSESRTVC
ncbi:hypothetical protein CPC08DRAFT_104232 [Agrocybe pediades]|nr:hypothetical protein CPC08DRAFT_104232 [Agrocybe pediades]